MLKAWPDNGSSLPPASIAAVRAPLQRSTQSRKLSPQEALSAAWALEADAAAARSECLFLQQEVYRLLNQKSAAEATLRQKEAAFEAERTALREARVSLQLAADRLEQGYEAEVLRLQSKNADLEESLRELEAELQAFQEDFRGRLANRGHSQAKLAGQVLARMSCAALEARLCMSCWHLLAKHSAMAARVTARRKAMVMLALSSLVTSAATETGSASCFRAWKQLQQLVASTATQLRTRGIRAANYACRLGDNSSSHSYFMAWHHTAQWCARDCRHKADQQNLVEMHSQQLLALREQIHAMKEKHASDLRKAELHLREAEERGVTALKAVQAEHLIAYSVLQEQAEAAEQRFQEASELTARSELGRHLDAARAELRERELQKELASMTSAVRTAELEAAKEAGAAARVAAQLQRQAAQDRQALATLARPLAALARPLSLERGSDRPSTPLVTAIMDCEHIGIESSPSGGGTSGSAEPSSQGVHHWLSHSPSSVLGSSPASTIKMGLDDERRSQREVAFSVASITPSRGSPVQCPGLSTTRESHG